MLVHYDILGYNTWVSDVRVHLYQNGFGYIYIWETREEFNHNLFYLNMYKDQNTNIFSSGSLSVLNPANCFITVTIN